MAWYRRTSVGTNTPLKSTIAPHALTIICRHHVKLNEDDLADEALLAFVQGYANISLKGDEWPTSREDWLILWIQKSETTTSYLTG